jgi:hypothetical protein
MRVRTSIPCAVAALAVSAGFATEARAGEQASSLLNDTLTASLGTFLLHTDTRIRVDGTAGPGTDVNLDKDLGLQDKNRFRVDATWRFAERHKLRALYFDTSQSETKTLSGDVTIGDAVYHADAALTSELSTKIMELAYEYVFLKRDTFEVSASAGVHAIKFDFTATGTATVNSVSGQAQRKAGLNTAPLPVIGARGLWEFSPDWYLDAQAQYFKVSVNGVDGHVSDIRTGVNWMFNKHLGIGAGWNQFVTAVALDKPVFTGQLRWRYSGGQIYITGSF